MRNTKKQDNLNYLTDKKYVIGIDPCGSRMDCILMDMQKNCIGKPFSFSTTHKGFNVDFFNKLEKCFKNGEDVPIQIEKILVAIEHSLTFWQQFAYFCKSKGMPVVLVNPVSTYYSRPLQNANFSKTDNKDAHLVAENACNGNFSTYHPLDETYRRARYISIYQTKITKDLQKEKARLTSLIKFRFPEFVSKLNIDTKTARFLLSKNIDAESYSAMNLEENYEQVKKISNNQICKSKLEKLKECSKKSINVPFESQEIKSDTQWIAIQIIKNIENLIRAHEELLEKFKDCFKGEPGFKVLMTVKGISIYSAAIFLAECGDLNNYNSYKQIEKLAGLNLQLKDSGNYSGPRKISKIGNKRLRTIIYQISTQLSRSEPSIRKKYLKRQIKKRSYKKNIIALSSNVIRLLLALVHQNRDYAVRSSDEKEIKLLELNYEEIKKAA